MSTATMINGILDRKQDRAHWLPYYLDTVSLLGVLIVLTAMVHDRDEFYKLAFFVAATIFVGLTAVQLFSSSHSKVSIATVIPVASLLVLGLPAAILVSVANGLLAIVTTSRFFYKQKPKQGRVPLLRRSAFNVGMQVISMMCSGVVYIGIGGVPGAPLSLNTVWALLPAVVVGDLIGTLLLLAAIRLQTGRNLRELWQRDWQWVLPISITASVIGGGGIAFAIQTTGYMGLVVYLLPVAATGYAFHFYVNRTRTYVEQLEAANQQLEEGNLGLLHTLGAIIDAYDIYTFGHSAQVTRYAQAIAKAMDLPQEEQNRIVRGALIHDIGKVGIADAIIGKEGKLTDEEYDALKLHTVIGAEIVSQMPQLRELAPLVRHHHERWDGRGYPDQLKGEENSLGARILCVADSVEAMLSDRPYQSTRTLAQVVTEVVRCSGSHFDPMVVKAFLQVTEEYGETFFVNSASMVARQLEKSGAFDSLNRRCYAKKSMIAQQLQNQSTVSTS